MNRILFSLLKFYCRLALPFYFNKWQVAGNENIPDGPVIFVANHQNAFLDAILVTCSSVKNPWFLTRADVFKNSYAKWILTKLKMLPVYRFRDGYKTLKQNEESFENCIRKLNSGESLLIFAEGNHGTRLQLRPLQKGVARIALEAAKSSIATIVPVGIHYEMTGNFRSRTLVSFGKPVSVNEFIKMANTHRNSMDLLLEKIKLELQPLMLHIDDDRYHEKYEFLLQHRNFSQNMVVQLKNDQQTLTSFPEKPDSEPIANSPDYTNTVLQKYVSLNLFIPSLVIRWLILEKIGDPQFRRSVLFAAGIFIVPPLLILQGWLLMWITGLSVIIPLYLVSVPAAVYLSKPSG